MCGGDPKTCNVKIWLDVLKNFRNPEPFGCSGIAEVPSTKTDIDLLLEDITGSFNLKTTLEPLRI